MSARARLALVGLGAAVVLALLVGSATARNLSLSNQNFRIVYFPITVFGEGGIAAEVECPLTLSGTFHYVTMAKSPASLVGFINRVTVGPRETCTGGAMTVLTATLPWHVKYNDFTGTLPRVTGVRFRFAVTAFLIEVGLGTSCLYEGTEGDAAATAVVEAGGAITGMTFDNTIRLDFIRGTFGCPPEGGLEGTGTVAVTGTATRITVRLI